MNRHRTAVIETLHYPTAEGLQQFYLFGGFYTFGHNLHIEVTGNRNNIADNRFFECILLLRIKT